MVPWEMAPAVVGVPNGNAAKSGRGGCAQGLRGQTPATAPTRCPPRQRLRRSAGRAGNKKLPRRRELVLKHFFA